MVNPSLSRVLFLSVASTLASASRLVASPTMVEVRITVIPEAVLPLMMTTSGLKPTPVMARLSLPFPVYVPEMTQASAVPPTARTAAAKATSAQQSFDLVARGAAQRGSQTLRSHQDALEQLIENTVSH